MVLQIHHDRYGHKYYTYPEYSKLYHDYCVRGPQLFYEPNRTRWYYHCYWPQEALNFATAEDKRRRMIVSREKINFNYFLGGQDGVLGAPPLYVPDQAIYASGNCEWRVDFSPAALIFHITNLKLQFTRRKCVFQKFFLSLFQLRSRFRNATFIQNQMYWSFKCKR